MSQNKTEKENKHRLNYQVWLKQKCEFCGKININHSFDEARRCNEKRINGSSKSVNVY